MAYPGTRARLRNAALATAFALAVHLFALAAHLNPQPTATLVQGILYIQMDAAGAWRSHVARELRDANLPVDLNRA